MIPLRDELPTIRPPIATVALIALNVAAWLLLQGFGSERALLGSICTLGLIPAELLGSVPPGVWVELGPGARCQLGDGAWYTLLSSMFLHGGWFHIIGNMWFLWVFGDNVEDAMGPGRYVVFYLTCGLAAAAAQIMSAPGSVVPMVGASGAIGGVMGAYARLYPRSRIHTLIVLGFFITTVAVPAVLMLGYWFVLQLLGGLPTLGGAEGGVAFWAHVGGFVAGLALAKPMAKPEYLYQHLAQAGRQQSRHRF